MIKKRNKLSCEFKKIVMSINLKKPYSQSTEVAGSGELGPVHSYHNRAWFRSAILSFQFIYNDYVAVIVGVNAT